MTCLRNLTSDFETTTLENDCRVWAWAICEIGNTSNFIYGNTLDGFINYCKESKENLHIYFHNLKFDGNFLIPWLFENGYSHTTEKKLLPFEFSTLITDMNVFYSVKVCFSRKGKTAHTVTFYDSLKILPFSVDEVAKSFKLPITKLKIDYKEFREIGHELTEVEIEYIKNDVTIMALALDQLFTQGLTKMTQASNALHDYKKTISKEKFDIWFPVPNYDYDVRQSYKGGFCYLNPKYKNVDVESGVVLDVNSLYPSVMRYKRLPYGEGVYFSGEYRKDELYNLYVQMFTCNFVLKPEHIPMIQIKNPAYHFMGTEYLTNSNGDDVTMCLTSVDLKLFFDQYDVYNITYIGGWKFKSVNGLFNTYIDKWTEIKTQANIDGNAGLYTIAKRMLNALYGKFAVNPNCQGKIPTWHDGEVVYILGEKETRKPLYIPVGTFITSWARYCTITSAQKVYDRFIYADTDSLHLTGETLPEELAIDKYKLGYWKHENTFYKARFLRQKTYIEYYQDPKQPGNDKHVTCAGMPKSCYDYVTWENFHEGLQITDGRLQQKKVKGGIILVDRDFSIKSIDK